MYVCSHVTLKLTVIHVLLTAFMGSYTKSDVQETSAGSTKSKCFDTNSSNAYVRGDVTRAHLLDLLGVGRRRLGGFLPRFLDDEQYGDGGDSQQTNHKQRNCMW